MPSLGFLLALLLAPSVALPQKPAFTPADVHAIEALVVEALVPAEGKLGARPTKDRMLLIDPDRASAVMGKLVDGAPNPGLRISRAFRAANHDAAIQCASPPRGDCQVANDGVYLTISDAAFVPETGELRVHAGVTWTHALSGHHDLNGYDIDLFFARTDSGWRLVRKGTATVG
jgi:hypothetical protein